MLIGPPNYVLSDCNSTAPTTWYPATISRAEQQRMQNALFSILLHYVSAMKSVPYDREQQGNRVITTSCIIIALDAVSRLMAHDQPSPLAVALQLAPESGEEGEGAESKTSEATKASQQSCYPERSPAFHFPLAGALSEMSVAQITKHCEVSDPGAAVARLCVDRYVRTMSAQGAGAPHLPAFTPKGEYVKNTFPSLLQSVKTF